MKKNASDGEETAQTTKLANDEENIIRYVGGYIVYKLPRKIKQNCERWNNHWINDKRSRQINWTGLYARVDDSSKP